MNFCIFFLSLYKNEISVLIWIVLNLLIVLANRHFNNTDFLIHEQGLSFPKHSFFLLVSVYLFLKLPLNSFYTEEHIQKENFRLLGWHNSQRKYLSVRSSV